MLRRQYLAGLAAGVAAACLPRISEASTAIALSLEELVNASRHSLVATPRDAYSLWEYVGDSQRIVTYTRIQVEEPLDDRNPASDEVLVRTLGGRVEKVAQVVPGEAMLTPGRTSTLFLEALRDSDALGVTAMSQGHFPLRSDARGVLRLRPSPNLPSLRHAERSATHLLDGRTVSEVRDLVRALGKAR